MRIEPWGEGDLPLLEKALGDPQMMEHLGGPERMEEIAKRQTGYERPDSGQFKIIDEATSEGAGWVGYWERTWRGQQVYEIGWSVIPAFQGRGIGALASAQAIEMARAEGKHRFLHAYPPSTTRRRTRFAGSSASRSSGRTSSSTRRVFMQCNDWRLDLLASS